MSRATLGELLAVVIAQMNEICVRVHLQKNAVTSSSDSVMVALFDLPCVILM